MGRGEVTVQPIEDEHAEAVAAFLHIQLNPRVAVTAWAALLDPPWAVEAPNHGFQLVVDSEIVGAYIAVYSERLVEGERRKFCNLAAFCVREDYRTHSFRLMRAILAQKGYEFTDFSPSGNVVALNERLGFVRLNTATRVTPNLPQLGKRGLTVSDDPLVVAEVLRGQDASIYHDHQRAPATRHIVAIAGAEYGYLIVRRDRRKRLPIFATPLYAGGSLELIRSAWPQLASHLLLRHGALATLAERRVLGFAPALGVDLGAPRAKMVRGSHVTAAAGDYLYSELTLVAW